MDLICPLPPPSPPPPKSRKIPMEKMELNYFNIFVYKQ